MHIKFSFKNIWVHFQTKKCAIFWHDLAWFDCSSKQELSFNYNLRPKLIHRIDPWWKISCQPHPFLQHFVDWD
jgi:hypothetical protein